jgi:hypothetical protein
MWGPAHKQRLLYSQVKKYVSPVTCRKIVCNGAFEEFSYVLPTPW